MAPSVRGLDHLESGLVGRSRPEPEAVLFVEEEELRLIFDLAGKGPRTDVGKAASGIGRALEDIPGDLRRSLRRYAGESVGDGAGDGDETAAAQFGVSPDDAVWPGQPLSMEIGVHHAGRAGCPHGSPEWSQPAGGDTFQAGNAAGCKGTLAVRGDEQLLSTGEPEVEKHVVAFDRQPDLRTTKLGGVGDGCGRPVQGAGRRARQSVVVAAVVNAAGHDGIDA